MIRPKRGPTLSNGQEGGRFGEAAHFAPCVSDSVIKLIATVQWRTVTVFTKVASASGCP